MGHRGLRLYAWMLSVSAAHRNMGARDAHPMPTTDLRASAHMGLGVGATLTGPRVVYRASNRVTSDDCQAHLVVRQTDQPVAAVTRGRRPARAGQACSRMLTRPERSCAPRTARGGR